MRDATGTLRPGLHTAPCTICDESKTIPHLGESRRTGSRGSNCPVLGAGGCVAVLGRKSVFEQGDDEAEVPSAAADIDYSRVEARQGALRTTVTQNLICAPVLALRIISLRLGTRIA
jgi:hypothetical protein